MSLDQKLASYVAAQDSVYAQVVSELTLGSKRSHWIWFVFPQVSGLGSSPMSKRYAFDSLDEARAFWNTSLLRERLVECTRLVLVQAGRDIEEIMGHPDHLTFRSCMTLFAEIAPDEPIFQQAIDVFFSGTSDQRTQNRLREWL